ncbi:MAG: FMN-binding protein, partial [Lachnospiraceae bacterium]|nr:FMN-binding protein [Lachnospiraceae bacterium]
VETEAAETEAAETEAAETEVTETLSTSAEETGSADGSVLYTPGTYTASAEGISSTITVNVTFDETGMYRIDYDLSGETAGLGADIGPEITSRILEAQSVDVDGVSGATVTSDAVKQAVEDCIAQALIVNAEDDAETEEETEAAETDAAETEAESEASEEETTAGNVETEEEAETDLADGSALYLAGTYTATAEGYSTEVTVAMTFDENNIVEMDADVSGETSTWALIDDDVVAQVLEAQSVDVDGISGATVTTDAILEAAEDCIAQAMIEEDDSDSASTIIGGADTPTEIYLTDNSSDAADAEDGAETEESDAEEESGAAAYIPGTYTATAEGISSTITVSVTFDETRIYRIDYDLSGETAGLGADIGPEITAQILEAQSVDVDGVSGATVTSDAVKQAVEDCIKQAQGSQE